MRTLRRIVESTECTVIMSIHQPHRRICECIDWLLALKDGELLYMGAMSEAQQCRDLMLHDMLAALKGNKSVQLTVDDVHVTSRPMFTTVPDQSVSADVQMSNMNVMGDFLDLKSARALSHMYNVQLVVDAQMDVQVLASLISQVMADGAAARNAADYLLETEYLATTRKLQLHWLAFRKRTYPDFAQTLDAALSANERFEHTVCGCCDVNKCCGCDVAEYCSAFLRCNTYRLALAALYGLYTNSDLKSHFNTIS